MCFTEIKRQNYIVGIRCATFCAIRRRWPTFYFVPLPLPLLPPIAGTPRSLPVAVATPPMPTPSPSWPRYACYCGSCCCRLVTSKSLPDPVRPRPGLPIVCSALLFCSAAHLLVFRLSAKCGRQQRKTKRNKQQKRSSSSRTNRSCNPLPQSADRKQLKQAELPRVAECMAKPLKRERAKWDKDEQSAHCDALQRGGGGGRSPGQDALWSVDCCNFSLN